MIKAAHEIDPELQLDIMGSYRRGAKDCGDVCKIGVYFLIHICLLINSQIDIIITKPDATTAELKREFLFRIHITLLFK